MPRLPHHSLFGTIAITTLAIGLVAITPTMAHKGAKGIVKERMDLMKDIRKHMKIIGQMIRGKTDFNAPAAKKSAKVIAAHANHMPMMFPKGSIKGPSEAVPEIWQDWPEFKRLATDLSSAAGQIESEASLTKERAGPLYKKMAATCSGCHKIFRKKKKKRRH